MKWCELSRPTPEENLACDEALLDLCEAGGEESLRLWRPASYFVVVGYANRVNSEVAVGYCEQQRIPILRRCSGGGTVLQGPGCLNYSLCLRIESAGKTRSISTTNHYVMETNREILGNLLGRPVEVRGHTDLAMDGLKFSGNAQRRRHRSLLFHGCFLLKMDLRLIGRTLLMPSKQPDYRANRSHEEFLTNLQVVEKDLAEALVAGWGADGECETVPREEIARLVEERYGRREWSFRF